MKNNKKNKYYMQIQCKYKKIHKKKRNIYLYNRYALYEAEVKNE